MKRKPLWMLAILLLSVGFRAGPPPSSPPPWNRPRAVLQGENLLVNGDMDQLAFYWRPTNHYVAGQWFEWWADRFHIPEYIDGGIPFHDVCYPPPPEGKSCADVNNHSQGYIRWGDPFAAGIYQPVHGTIPCVLYKFEIYNRNDSDNYHPRVGIDPTGWVITRLGNSPPDNCPPDGRSRCPDPYVGDDHGFPPTIIWSEERDHAPFTWAPISLTVEALATTISVWTHAGPDSGVSHSAYWDNGSVVQVPFPDGRLPAPESWTPSGFIQDVRVAALGDAIVTWKTGGPASTQVWYEITPAGATPGAPTYPRATSLDVTPATTHRAVINDLRAGETLSLVALSRRLDGGRCVTEVSEPVRITLPERIPPETWTPSPVITNVQARMVLDRLVVTWETPDVPATTQVWYTVVPAPPSLTQTLMVTFTQYLPLIATAHEPTYEATTPLDLQRSTTHYAFIDGLQEGDTVRLVAVSAYFEDESRIVAVASEPLTVREVHLPLVIHDLYLPTVMRMGK